MYIVSKSTVVSIIGKLKQYGTTQTLPRAGHPTKLSNRKRTRRTLVREVTKNQMTTLTELESALAEKGEPVRKHDRLCSTSPIWTLWGSGQTEATPVKKAHDNSLQKRHVKDFENRITQKSLWSDETNTTLWPECKALCLEKTRHSSSPI
jgi:hypothetical protein